MTSQRPDNFFFKGENAEVIAISSEIAFKPRTAFGVETMPWSTDNYRGFWCDYVIDEWLCIKNLYLCSEDGIYPNIFGKTAEDIQMYLDLCKKLGRELNVPRQYKEINYIVEYTGEMLLGIGETPVQPSKNHKDRKEPSGFQPGKKMYEQVYELGFEKGMLMKTREITDLWTSSGSETGHWWDAQDKKYWVLLNLAYMGCR